MKWIAIVIVGLIAIMGAAFYTDDQEMNAKQKTFMEGCVKDFKQYDCQMRWDTYAELHKQGMEGRGGTYFVGMPSSNGR